MLRPAPERRVLSRGVQAQTQAGAAGAAGHGEAVLLVVQACFAQKRKMLKNNLRAVCDDEVAAALEDLGRDEKTRAQQLTMEEYVRLFNFVRLKGAGRRESESSRVESAERVENGSREAS